MILQRAGLIKNGFMKRTYRFLTIIIIIATALIITSFTAKKTVKQEQIHQSQVRFTMK